jgi:hypothetical protein
VRRLVPLLFLALLALPASAAAAPPKSRALATDAAAKRTLVAAARRLEACRASTLDYTRCYVPPLSSGVLFDAVSFSTYILSARSRARRRFALARGHDGALVATCTPAGRGACPPAGVWKPTPRPAMTPPFGHEWLAHEREVVARFEALIATVEACRAATGGLDGCAATPRVWGARQYLAALTGQQPQVELGPHTYHAYVQAASSTEFVVTWMRDGGADRQCQKFLAHLVSPCVDGRW